AVVRAVDRGHAALAELVAELVAAEPVAGPHPAQAPARGLADHRLELTLTSRVMSRRRFGRRVWRRSRPVGRPGPRHVQLADHTTWLVLPAALAIFIALPSRRPSSSAPVPSWRPSVCAIASTRASCAASPGNVARLASNVDSALATNGRTWSGDSTAMKSEPPMWPTNAPPPDAARAESSSHCPRLRTVSSLRAMPIVSA